MLTPESYKAITNAISHAYKQNNDLKNPDKVIHGQVLIKSMVWDIATALSLDDPEFNRFTFFNDCKISRDD